jgi:hypothetical protein
MVIAMNEQTDAAEGNSDGKATWAAPRFERIDIGDAAGGDSFSGDAGSLS